MTLLFLRRFFLSAFVFGLALSCLLASAPAQANLTLSPLRIVLEGRERSAEVMVLNMSEKPATYRLGWTYNKMDEQGSYDPVPSTLTPEFDVGKHMVFSPRQVTLPAGGRQKVRLSLRREGELPPGEYRAHLVFQKLPDDRSASVSPEDTKPVKGKNLSLQVVMGFSIPVVVRSGPYDGFAEIVNQRFIPASQSKDGKPKLAFTINRTGKHSTIGNVTVHWDQSTHPDKRIGTLNNVAVYPEMTHRNVEINLDVPSIPSGNVTVRYNGDGPQKGTMLAEKTFAVGG